MFDDPLAEVFIWDEKDGAIFWCLIDNFGSIPRGADNVAKRLHTGRAIDVSDDVVILIFIFLQKGFEFVGGTSLFEGASSIFIGKNNCLFGVQNFGGFRHEMNTAECYNIGFGFLSFVSETE